jgi:hypothetical protein
MFVRAAERGRGGAPAAGVSNPTAAEPPAVATSEERQAWEKDHKSAFSITVPLESDRPGKHFGHLMCSASDDKVGFGGIVACTTVQLYLEFGAAIYETTM